MPQKSKLPPLHPLRPACCSPFIPHSTHMVYRELAQMVEAVIEDMLQPEQNNLLRPQ